MLVATVLTNIEGVSYPVRRLKAAQLAAMRVLGGLRLESFDTEADMRGQYRVVSEQAEGEYADKRHTLRIRSWEE
jgi:hypothetical protein